MTDIFDVAQDKREEVKRKGVKVVSAKAVKLPYFKSMYRSGDKAPYTFAYMKEGSNHSALTNTAIISLCTALTFEIVTLENERREKLNKKIKKEEEKHLPVPFDAAMIHTVATKREGFTEADLAYQNTKGLNRIQAHIRACIKKQGLSFTIDKESPFEIKGFTSKIACDIFSMT